MIVMPTKRAWLVIGLILLAAVGLTWWVGTLQFAARALIVTWLAVWVVVELDRSPRMKRRRLEQARVALELCQARIRHCGLPRHQVDIQRADLSLIAYRIQHGQLTWEELGTTMEDFRSLVERSGYIGCIGKKIFPRANPVTT
jgi:hypothetical protein